MIKAKRTRAQINDFLSRRTAGSGGSGGKRRPVTGSGNHDGMSFQGHQEPKNFADNLWLFDDPPTFPDDDLPRSQTSGKTEKPHPNGSPYPLPA